jgi:hypothetical protein
MSFKGRLLGLVILTASLLVVSHSRPGSAAPQERSGSASEQVPGSVGEDEDLQEFVPTEEIPAGSSISFPVDI